MVASGLEPIRSPSIKRRSNFHSGVLIDAESGQIVFDWIGGESFSYSPDSNTLAWGINNDVHVTDLQSDLSHHDAPFTSNSVLLEDLPGDIFKAVAYSPDGLTLAVASIEGIWETWGFSDAVGFISLWDVESGKQKRVIEDETIRGSSIYSPISEYRRWGYSPRAELEFSPNGELIAIAWPHPQYGYGSLPGKVGIRDAHTLELKRTFVGTGAVRFIEFSPDGLTLASGGHSHYRTH